MKVALCTLFIILYVKGQTTVVLTPTYNETITTQAIISVLISDGTRGQFTIGLFGEAAPKTVENFMQLCSGENGKTPEGHSLSYVDTFFFRIISGKWIQGGDIINNDGTSGASIYGKKFKAEQTGLKHKKHCATMINSGDGTHSSQFAITLGDTPWFDGKHSVFGEVYIDEEFLDVMESYGSETGKPTATIEIERCHLF